MTTVILLMQFFMMFVTMLGVITLVVTTLERTYNMIMSALSH
ncbi:hypothetical protein ACRHK7_04410 [Weissella tructae]|uniref:Uncharacterized protein n=2 Tax=Weissella TaxID=46255 RepID=A0A075TYU5_9LACO|nr:MULTISPECIES: hypothetical protein [Weissella]AIG65083.1 hypothetical protein WS08_0144 [Weissella tructae]AIM62397.1 hypothetical protein WS74_0145 [Weissella ceti]AIM63734.1 hypothetical protein WS105_0144 [Weissella ceti]